MLNLKPWELWDLSWGEFWEMYEGWATRREYEFEHTRFVAWTINATSWSPQKHWKTPAHVMPLAGIDPKPKQNSAEEVEAFRQRISQRLGREITFMKATNE